MNDFKKNLREFNAKLIDEKIQFALEEKLNKLESMTDIEEYQHHISGRKVGILNILNNFNYVISIFESNKKFVSLEKKKKDISYQYALDKIIKRIITEELELLYQNVSLSTSSSSARISEQIFDRKIKIAELLDNYDDNMKYLKGYIEESKNSDFEQLLH